MYYVQLLSSSPIILSCVSLLLLLLRLLLFLLLTSSSSSSSIFVSPPTESSFILPFLFFYFLIYFFLFVSFDINVLSHAKRSAPPLSPLYNLDQGAGFLANGISDRSSKRHADAFWFLPFGSAASFFFAARRIRRHRAPPLSPFEDRPTISFFSFARLRLYHVIHTHIYMYTHTHTYIYIYVYISRVYIYIPVYVLYRGKNLERKTARPFSASN